MSKFMEYAENRETYLVSMLKFYRKHGDVSNEKRIQREIEKLRENILRATARFAGQVC